MIRIIPVLAIAFLFASPSFADDETEFVDAYKKYEALVVAEKNEEAIPYAERALALGEKLFGGDSGTVSILTYNLGVTLSNAGNPRAAREPLRRAVKLYEAIHGTNSLELIEPLSDLAGALSSFEFDETVRHYERALKIAERHYGKKDPKLVRFLLWISNAEMRRGDGRAARHPLDRAIKILENAGDEHVADYGFTLFHYGKLKMGLKSNKDAEKHFLQALEKFEGHLPDNHDIVRLTHEFLIQIYERLDRREEATPYLQRLSSIKPDPDDNSEISPMYRVVPTYPPSAAWNEKEGHVDLQFTVDEKGFVKNVVVTESKPGKTFVNSALECVQKWRYKPKIVNGQYVARDGVEVRITFELED